MDDRTNILRQMKICRFCLSEDAELSGIHDKVTYEPDIKSVPLPLQIMACIAIEVFRNDGMPQLICNTCRSLTIQAYNFKTNCKKADDALRLFLATGQLSKPHIVNNLKGVYLPKKPSTKSGSNEQDNQVAQHSIMNEDEISAEGGTELNDEEEGYEEGVRTLDSNDEEEEEEDNESYANRLARVDLVKTDCFPCPHCERSFPLKQLLDLHVSIHKRERSFTCPECKKKFFTKHDLQKHFKTHNPLNLYPCSVCKKSFSKQSLLSRHEMIHNDVPKYICTQCDKTFLKKEYLDFHMEKHNKKKPFNCNVCDKSFVFKQGLERHMVVHREDRPHKCNYCEASFTSAIKLTRHITSHAGLRPYPCKLCRRTFLLSHHLTRHMRSHYVVQSTSRQSGIGQHKCDICSMAFKKKDSLINHSVIHSMVNLRCVICNTAFETADLVKDHITTHLTRLPFRCEKCGYSFETSEQLEEHELKHAEMEYEEQIEKEVLSEVRAQVEGPENDDHEVQTEEEEEECEDGEITEYTIPDINNPEVVPVQVRSVEQNEEAEDEEHYSGFFKSEIPSDDEEQPQQRQSEPEEEPVQEVIKPIIRQEGTKVYQRKPTEKKAPALNDIRLSSLKETTQVPLPEVRIETTYGNLSPQMISNLQNKKVSNMKVGEKTVRVQKFIVTKEEMKEMAKQGILEMKGGQVVLKNAGQPIINATLKPIQKTDIESLLDKKSEGKSPVKRYQKRPLESDRLAENTAADQ
nr:zinc finger protein 84-like [Leptinotarsa decemlineata]